MTGLNHAATGALVAVVIKQPALALPLAFLMHFGVDAIPHWDYKISGPRRKLIMRADLLASFCLLAVLALTLKTPAWEVAACGLLCMAPDAIWLPEILHGKPSIAHSSLAVSQVREAHRFIQWNESGLGIYAESVWFVAVLALILLLGR